MSPDAVLVAVRFVHFAATLGLVGATLFGFYAGPSGASPVPRFRFLAGVAALSAVAWLWVEAAHLGGDWASAFDPDTLRATALETAFGTVWLGRLALAAVLLLATVIPVRRSGIAALSVLLAGSLGLVGHAAMDDGIRGWLHEGCDALHLLAAGTWLGSLWPLARALRTEPAADRRAALLDRYSAVGMAAVAVIVISGVGNATLILGARPLAGIGTIGPDWGRTLAVKLALVAILVTAATVNRFVLMPRRSHTAIARMVAVEQGLILAVVMAASLLGTLSPYPEGQ